MANELYILCPGQGAQVVGMGKSAFDACAAARQLYETAAMILGFDLAQVSFGGPQEKLNQTNVCQPALFTAAMASFTHAIETGLFDAAATSALAGLSLGEYTALHLAGVFGFEDGLKLVHQRGSFMQQAAEATKGSMVALLGADAAAAQDLCQKCAGGEVLVAANFNAPGQIVLSGSVGACKRAAEAAAAAGLKATALQVAGAFHSPLMQSAADQMRAALDAVPFAAARKTVYSNVTASPHENAESIKKLLVEQIVSPVRWEQTMTKLAGTAEARFIELSPGRTLAGLAKRINRRLPVQSLG